MIQWRNFNIDPDWYLGKIGASDKGEIIGIKQMMDLIREEFPDLKFSIGGQISIDIFPKNWNKTYCLQFIDGKYNKIHFFGDNTQPGGNDYEIYNDSRVEGKTVTKWQDTYEMLQTF